MGGKCVVSALSAVFRINSQLEDISSSVRASFSRDLDEFLFETRPKAQTMLSGKVRTREIIPDRWIQEGSPLPTVPFVCTITQSGATLRAD